MTSWCGIKFYKLGNFQEPNWSTIKEKKKNEDNLVVDITYHPSLVLLKVIMTRIHLHLTPDSKHNMVFRDVPIIGFRRAKF